LYGVALPYWLPSSGTVFRGNKAIAFGGAILKNDANAGGTTMQIGE